MTQILFHTYLITNAKIFHGETNSEKPIVLKSIVNVNENRKVSIIIDKSKRVDYFQRTLKNI